MGLREIARKLNGKRTYYKGRQVVCWDHKYILENPLYKGIAHYKENNVKNKDLALF